MYLRDLANSLLRRWILVIAILAMTFGVCWLTSRLVLPSHETNASVVLVPPKSVVEPTANRFLELSSLAQATDVLARALNADTTQALVHETEPEGKYEVAVDPTTNAPVLIVTVEAPTATEADVLVEAVLKQVPLSLSTLQSSLSITRGAEITSIPLERGVEPRLHRTSQLRAVAAVGVLFLGGGAMLIGAIDGVLLVRAAKKEMKGRHTGSGLGMPPGVGAAEEAAWLDALAAISGQRIVDEQATCVMPTKTPRNGRVPLRAAKMRTQEPR